MRKTQGAGSRKTRDPALVGDVPALATSQDLLAANPPLTGRTHARQTAAKAPGRINLKAVADACIEAGLDPAVEILRALNQKQLVLDRSGTPVIDPMTGEPMYVDAVDPDTRLRTLNELLQYTQPKLKAVEVKMSGSLELSGEQLDQRLQALISKAVR